MARIKGNLEVYLLRHAEAFKNLVNIHGGGDQTLTDKGKHQAVTMGRYLSEKISTERDLRIVCQPEGRSRLTAERLGKITSSTIVECSEFGGVGLGIVGGLTENELTRLYPEVAVALKDWRDNRGDLKKRPRVPGSEPMEAFAERIKHGLLANIKSSNPNSALVIVGTTSTLNMMNHLFVNDGYFDRSRYDFINFPLGSLAVWQISSEEPKQTMAMYVPMGATEGFANNG